LVKHDNSFIRTSKNIIEKYNNKIDNVNITLLVKEEEKKQVHETVKNNIIAKSNLYSSLIRNEKADSKYETYTSGHKTKVDNKRKDDIFDNVGHDRIVSSNVSHKNKNINIKFNHDNDDNNRERLFDAHTERLILKYQKVPTNVTTTTNNYIKDGKHGRMKHYMYIDSDIDHEDQGLMIMLT